MTGMYKRMDNMVKQDKVVTFDVIHKLVEGLERYFLSEQELASKGNISDIAVFIVSSFLGDLRR